MTTMTVKVITCHPIPDLDILTRLERSYQLRNSAPDNFFHENWLRSPQHDWHLSRLGYVNIWMDRDPIQIHENANERTSIAKLSGL
jgi:hypothetical protein